MDGSEQCQVCTYGPVEFEVVDRLSSESWRVCTMCLADTIVAGLREYSTVQVAELELSAPAPVDIDRDDATRPECPDCLSADDVVEWVTLAQPLIRKFETFVCDRAHGEYSSPLYFYRGMPAVDVPPNKTNDISERELVTKWARTEWIGTFGVNTPQGDRFVRIKATDRNEASRKMHDRYGTAWAFLYESEEEAGVEQFGLTEIGAGR